MTTLLHIDASLDRQGSATRRLSGDFVDRWARAHPEATILRRDLALDPAPVLTETFIRAAKTPPDRRLRDLELARSRRDAALVGNAGEQPQLVEGEGVEGGFGHGTYLGNR